MSEEKRRSIVIKLDALILTLRTTSVVSYYSEIWALKNEIYEMSFRNSESRYRQECSDKNIEWIQFTYLTAIKNIPTFPFPQNMKKELSTLKNAFEYPIRMASIAHDEKLILLEYYKHLEVFNKFILIKYNFGLCLDVIKLVVEMIYP